MAGHISDEGQLPNKLKAKKSNSVWSGAAWICSKQLTHYPSLNKNGITITVNSFAIIMAEEESHYLGYLEDFYENKKGQKKAKVQWCLHFHEVQCVIPQLEGHPREVLLTSHVQVINAESINALATVLTPTDYEKYISFVPQSLACGVYMCYREFRNNKVTPFTLSQLDGYYNQMIFTMLHRQQVSQLTSVKDVTRGDPSRQGPSGSRSVEEYPILESGPSGIKKSIPGNQITKAGPTWPKLKIKFPSLGPVGMEIDEPQRKSSLEVGDNIEVLCQDSGVRGCWFRCTLLQISQEHLKVQYDDLLDCDGPEKLKEWIPSNRVASSDKLGMRYKGRLTVRPWPPEYSSSDYSFEVGAAVDAWWSDGWWEGVVAGFDVRGSGHFQVYLPDENILLEFQRKNLRISRDWIDDKWIEVKGMKDIKSFISSKSTKVSKRSSKEPAGNREKQIALKLMAPCEDKKKASTSKHSKKKKGITGMLKLKKRWYKDFLAGKN